MLAVLTAAILSVSPIAEHSTGMTPTCFGPCYAPDCPEFEVYVCNETPGQTKVLSKSGKRQKTSTMSATSTAGLSQGGGAPILTPVPPNTWGTVSDCGDLYGDC
jgi:hypothetical protein